MFKTMSSSARSGLEDRKADKTYWAVEANRARRYGPIDFSALRLAHLGITTECGLVVY